MPPARFPLHLSLLVLALILWFGPDPSAAQEEGLRYPENLAWRLVTEREVQDLTGCPQALGGEEREAPPLFPPPTAPLQDLPPVPDSAPVLVRPDDSWQVAPFPAIDPPPPAGLPPELREQWELDRSRTARQAPTFGGLGTDAVEAPSFGEVPTELREIPSAFEEVDTRVTEAPSALLRPRPAFTSDRLVRPLDELPAPFTLRRYHTEDRGFFQVALYGGTTGFVAERAWRTLRAAAPNRKPVLGVGEEAFMALIPLEEPTLEPDPSPSASPEQPAEEPAQGPAEGPAFAQLEPAGQPRPDLVDPGLIKASSAPAFRSIPVDIGLPQDLGSTRKPEKPQEPEKPEAPKEARPPGPTAGPDGEGPAAEAWDPLEKNDPEPFGGRVAPGLRGVQVLVAFLPSKGVVLELAMDDRIGDSQSLVRLAFLVQARLLQRW